MKKWVVVLIFVFLIPLAYSMSIKDLISRYLFSSSVHGLNVTGYTDFMADRNGNGENDTLIFELTTSGSSGSYIFALSLFDKDGILTNETNRTLNSGISKLNISFGSLFLTQPKFNYSIKVYNSTYGLQYRKDNIETNYYQNYEKGFEILGISDFKAGNSLYLNITINSSANGTFETALFLSYNSSAISAKENKSITNLVQDMIFGFGNETMKRTHFEGNFNISSLKIGKKTLKPGYLTGFYNFRDFASASYILGFADSGIDSDLNNKFDSLKINLTLAVANDGYYTYVLALYDLFGNIVQIKNESVLLVAGNRTISHSFNGSGIYNKKLNGPFAVKYAELYQNGSLIDKISDAYTTKSYNFNDFESNLPDLIADISASDGYHYGIGNVTINFTFKNAGNRPAFNVFTSIFDNKTFSKANKTNIIAANSKISHQVNFTNISDFEINSFVDLQDFVDESNESNNAKKITIKLNRRPSLSSVGNLIINETDDIELNLSASDPNNDDLYFSINSSKFSYNSNEFKWLTKTTDSGNYTLMAAASDGFLNDSKIFKITILNVPEKDADDDGINDSVDRLFGDENSVNTSTISLKIFLGNSSNLSRILNESTKVKFTDKNTTIIEFDFDFSLNKLNLTNLTINKQSDNSTGSLIVSGLRMPDGLTKTLYVDKINSAINGICVKDREMQNISEISGNCDSNDEFKVECDGTLQNSYICTYNLMLEKYKIEGLRHSGIIQFDYKKPESSQNTISSGAPPAASSGGGGGTACIPDWQCGGWSECVDGIRSRKCDDEIHCSFSAKKPLESQKCSAEEIKATPIQKEGINKKNSSSYIKKESAHPPQLLGITSRAIGLLSTPESYFRVFDFFSIILALGVVYSAIYFLFLENL